MGSSPSCICCARLLAVFVMCSTQEMPSNSLFLCSCDPVPSRGSHDRIFKLVLSSNPLYPESGGPTRRQRALVRARWQSAGMIHFSCVAWSVSDRAGFQLLLLKQILCTIFAILATCLMPSEEKAQMRLCLNPNITTRQ